jgi:hypothetical protein
VEVVEVNDKPLLPRYGSRQRIIRNTPALNVCIAVRVSADEGSRLYRKQVAKGKKSKSKKSSGSK